MCYLAKFHLVDVLLLIAVVAFQYAVLLVYHVEHGLHGLVVGDALGVVAFHDAT